MAKDTLMQFRYIAIPETTGTNIYQTVFKSDDMYKYLSGIATSITGNYPDADAIEIELRDDFKTIFSFSPGENWLKNTASANYSLRDVFKPICTESHGKQFYLNVKVTNCAAFAFTAIFKQTMQPEQVARYDMQNFRIEAPALGQNVAITLPADYSRCKGIQVTGGDTANAAKILLDINDASGNIVDPVPFSVLTVTSNTQHNESFFPVDFASASKQIYARLTNVAPIDYTATTYNVTFLLVE